MSTIGERVREERTKRKLSQRDLAKLAKISHAYVSLIEVGKKRPTIRTISVLARALGVKPGFLAYGPKDLIEHD